MDLGTIQCLLLLLVLQIMFVFGFIRVEKQVSTLNSYESLVRIYAVLVKAPRCRHIMIDKQKRSIKISMFYIDDIISIILLILI